MSIRKNDLYRLISLISICIIIILANAINVYAAGNPVTVDSVSATNSTVNTKGSTDAVSIMVQVRDSSDAVVAMSSFGTADNGSTRVFDATITGLNLAPGQYKVYVADYEGGPWSSADVTVVPGSSDESTQAAPNQAAVINNPSVSVNQPANTETINNNKNSENTQTIAPQTGDNHNPALYIGMIAIGAAIVVLCGKKIKK